MIVFWSLALVELIRVQKSNPKVVQNQTNEEDDDDDEQGRQKLNGK